MTKQRKGIRVRRKVTIAKIRMKSKPARQRRMQMTGYNPASRFDLDAAALQWAALLNDPCNARLTYPCYPSGNAGTVLIRLEQDNILFNEVSATAGFGVWVPGAAAFLRNTIAVTDDTAGSTLTNFAALGAGYSYIAANASSFRCVAGCLQITYPGSELSRSGIIGLGVVEANAVLTSVSTGNGGGNLPISASAVRVACQQVGRTPADVYECKWFPGQNDQASLTNIIPANISSVISGRNAIAFSAAGLPAGVGIRVRTVAVFEVSLDFGEIGVVASVAPPTSTSSMASVVKFLQDKDPSWYINVARKAYDVVDRAISYAKQGSKYAGAIAGAVALL